jgi:hypothetical protein
VIAANRLFDNLGARLPCGDHRMSARKDAYLRRGCDRGRTQFLIARHDAEHDALLLIFQLVLP